MQTNQNLMQIIQIKISTNIHNNMYVKYAIIAIVMNKMNTYMYMLQYNIINTELILLCNVRIFLFLYNFPVFFKAIFLFYHFLRIPIKKHHYL